MKTYAFIIAMLSPILISAQDFIDIRDSLNIHYSYGDCFLAAGIAFVDINGDGWDDVLVPSCEGTSFHYYQNGPNGFVEVFKPEFAFDTFRVKTIIPADIDNDGDQDLFIGNMGVRNHIYLNDGNGNFTDVTNSSGLTNENYDTFVASFGDYDNDGWLDLYVGNRAFDLLNTQPNILYHNNGDGTFTDAQDTLLSDTAGALLACAWLDINNDGWLDLYLANDKGFGNRLYKNLGNGTFEDISVSSGTDTSMNAMSMTVADYNNDNFLDFYITNTAQGNVFFVNNGDETFDEVAIQEGVEVKKTSWGAVFFDYDNDTDWDLYVPSMMNTNGGLVYNDLFESINGSFVNQAGIKIDSSLASSMGGAIGDFDQDGFYDLVVLNNQGAEMNFYSNQGNSNHFIRVQLEGVVSNRDAVGSWVWVHSGNQVVSRFTHCGFDFASQNSNTHIIGIGQKTSIDSVVIRYPSGIRNTHTNLLIDSLYHFVEDTTTVVDTSTSVHQITGYALDVQTQIFPNPVQNEVHLSFMVSGKKEITIYNANGKLMFRKDVEAKSTSLDIASFTSGIYFVQVASNGHSAYYRIVKN